MKRGVEQRDSLSEKPEVENIVPIPHEVSVKPEVLAKPETFPAKPEIVFAKPANVAEQGRIDGYVGFANNPNQVFLQKKNSIDKICIRKRTNIFTLQYKVIKTLMLNVLP